MEHPSRWGRTAGQTRKPVPSSKGKFVGSVFEDSRETHETRGIHVRMQEARGRHDKPGSQSQRERLVSTSRGVVLFQDNTDKQPTDVMWQLPLQDDRSAIQQQLRPRAEGTPGASSSGGPQADARALRKQKAVEDVRGRTN